MGCDPERALGHAGCVARPAPVAPNELRATGARLALLLVCVLAAGCGFHTKGSATLPFSSIYIQAPLYSSFAGEMKRYIASGGRTTLARQREEADVILDITGEEQQSQILSLSTAGTVLEYLLRYRVAYRLHDNRSRDWIPPGEIVLQRDLTYDVNAVLAKEIEQNLLFEDMRADAVRQMMRRMAAAHAPS
ncbi:MAG TPA: LPS assembly lipoprotein LptE [Burkholderiales bacterium]|nr:LPS assembly lipoprotein LptE [Burkholderiales bacterium]